MRRALQGLSWLALLGTIAPAVLYLSGGLELAALKTAMLLATLLWFLTVPFWMERPR
ncbi:MAG: hypothetical protein ISR76_08725 [Planctomycetes bacterium]|nr:hypothetical protein [Planctomycetota bacterium]MBL7009067.1 hypothetical protein [Planctomycetota bacterium]